MADETTPKIRPIDADQQPRNESPPPPPKVTPDPPPRRARRGDDARLRENLTRFYATVGGGIATAGMLKSDVGLVASGTNIGTKAQDTAEAWMELADTNPKVKLFLESFMTGSSIANLVAIHLSMVVPLFASQGLIPAPLGEMFLTDEAKEAATTFYTMQQAAAAAAATGNGNPQ